VGYRVKQLAGQGRFLRIPVLLTKAVWREQDHPRDDSGEFTDKRTAGQAPEAGAALVAPHIMEGYDRAFTGAIEGVAARTQHPALRATLQQWAAGHGIARQALAGVVRTGLHRRMDPEEAMNLLAARLLMPRPGGASLFGDFRESPPAYAGDNPLRARFHAWLDNSLRELRNRAGKLGNVEHLPGERVPVGPGRKEEPGEETRDVEARPEAERDFYEMLEDVRRAALARGEEAGLPMADVWDALTSRVSHAERERRFGRDRARAAFALVRDTVRHYAEATGNDVLLSALGRMEAGEKVRRRAPGATAAGRALQRAAARASALPPEEADEASIRELLESRRGEGPGRFGISLGEIRKKRGRWTGEPPHDPNSPHGTRLRDTLARMVAKGILEERTRGRATLYYPGPNYPEGGHEGGGLQ
jgi:hypothetical protein